MLSQLAGRKTRGLLVYATSQDSPCLTFLPYYWSLNKAFGGWRLYIAISPGPLFRMESAITSSQNKPPTDHIFSSSIHLACTFEVIVGPTSLPFRPRAFFRAYTPYRGHGHFSTSLRFLRSRKFNAKPKMRPCRCSHAAA